MSENRGMTTIGQFLMSRFDEGWEAEEAKPFPEWSRLADYEAKRDIVREHVGYGGICGTCGVRKPETGEPWPCRTLRLLAYPYIGHPEMREEWRP